MADFEKETGARIRAVRISRKMSQAELAEAVDVSTPNISDIERGNTSMRVHTLAKIAEALQVSADSLLRIDTPESNLKYQQEFAALLDDCNPTEIDTIMRVVKEVKAGMRQQREKKAD